VLALLGTAHRKGLPGGSARLPTLRRTAQGSGLNHQTPRQPLRPLSPSPHEQEDTLGRVVGRLKGDRTFDPRPSDPRFAARTKKLRFHR
jgi:hypothetical protein